MELSKKELAILIGALGDLTSIQIEDSVQKSSTVRDEDKVFSGRDESLDLYIKLIKLYHNI